MKTLRVELAEKHSLNNWTSWNDVAASPTTNRGCV